MRDCDNVHYGDPRTLRHVFFGELWRGRDNVRVSLRAPRSWRTLVSAAIPAFNLLALVVVVAGLFSGLPAGRIAAVVAGLAVVGLMSLRASIMSSGGPSRDWLPALAVAAAYELGRAFALAARAGYGRRRRGVDGVSEGRLAILELRSVRGTGGGPEKTILSARSGPTGRGLRSPSATCAICATRSSASTRARASWISTTSR